MKNDYAVINFIQIDSSSEPLHGRKLEYLRSSVQVILELAQFYRSLLRNYAAVDVLASDFNRFANFTT